MLAKVIYIGFYRNRIIELEIFAETHITDNDAKVYGLSFLSAENKCRFG